MPPLRPLAAANRDSCAYNCSAPLHHGRRRSARTARPTLTSAASRGLGGQRPRHTGRAPRVQQHAISRDTHSLQLLPGPRLTPAHGTSAAHSCRCNAVDAHATNALARAAPAMRTRAPARAAAAPAMHRHMLPTQPQTRPARRGAKLWYVIFEGRCCGAAEVVRRRPTGRRHGPLSGPCGRHIGSAVRGRPRQQERP